MQELIYRDRAIDIALRNLGPAALDELRAALDLEEILDWKKSKNRNNLEAQLYEWLGTNAADILDDGFVRATAAAAIVSDQKYSKFWRKSK